MRDFERRYRHHFRLLVSMYRARGLKAATAEDLAQETLVRAYASLGRFDPSRPMWPWIKTIGRRVATDHRRKPDRELPAELGDGPGIPSESDRVDERGILEQARARLTRRQDLAVRLRYEEDREPRHAALVLGVSVAAFNQLLFRARQRLREEYGRLSDGVPVLVWLRWIRARARSLCRRGLSPSSWRAGDAAERIIGAGALSVCLVLIPLLPIDDASPPTSPRPGVERPPSLALQPALQPDRAPTVPPHARSGGLAVPRAKQAEGSTESGGSADAPGGPGGEPAGQEAGEGAGEEAGGETAPPPPGSPSPSIPDPGEPPPTDPALTDPDLVDTEPDPEDVVEDVLSNPALNEDPPPPLDPEGVDLP